MNALAILEEWREVPGFPNYAVSNLGRVRGARGGILIPYPGQSGYLRIGISLGRDGYRRFEYVHRLVLFAFVGPPAEYEQGHHKDGDKENNALYNLEWCDGREHQRFDNYGRDIKSPF